MNLPQKQPEKIGRIHDESAKSALLATAFTDAIKTLAARPDALDNLENYLVQHFEIWLKKYANTPESITAELKAFSDMKF